MNSMTAAGVAMIQGSLSMDAAATVMISTGSQPLVDLGQHWALDARALADRGAWMITSATSDSMVHDPGKARALDLVNLKANGAVMETEGNAMAQHGREMVAQVDRLRTDGTVDAATLDDLTARGQELVTTSETMNRDGKRMQDDADRLQRSLANSERLTMAVVG